MTPKQRIDREYEKLKKKGLLEVVELLLVSPEFFKELRYEVGCLGHIRRHSGLHKYYLAYSELKILPYEKIRGEFIMTCFAFDKLS